MNEPYSITRTGDGWLTEFHVEPDFVVVTVRVSRRRFCANALREAVAMRGVIKVAAPPSPRRAAMRRAATEARRAVIAAEYVHACKMGLSATNEYVADSLGLDVRHVTREIFEARRDGLLTGGGRRGVHGGELTTKAGDILRAIDMEEA